MNPARTLVVCSVAAAVVVACGGAKKPAAAPSVSQRCPDLTKADELTAFDFAKEYSLSREAADKLKASTLAALEIETLSDRLDGDFGIACAQIASDLGNKGTFRSGGDACTAAIKSVQDARAKLGPRAQVSLVVRQPVCLTDASLMTKCASLCDSSVPAGKVHAECTKNVGRCDGNCDGMCEPKGDAKCDGQCMGTCSGAMKGSCGGRCTGKCDGKRSNGSCLGTCDGLCEKSAMSGECRGVCAGECKLAKAGICDGVCAGSCSVELSESKCAGEFKVPEVSTDCRARCDLAVMNHTECSVPHVGFVAANAKDREAAETMKASVDRAFPALLKILAELGDKSAKRVLTAQAVIDGTRAGFKDLARSGSASTAAASETQLGKCFDERLKKAAATAAATKVLIDQANGVREEASKTP